MLTSGLSFIWRVFIILLNALVGASHQRKPFRRDRPSANFDTAYSKPALTDIDVRRRLGDLPRAQVLSVIDGDSLVVSILRDEDEVRLDSIDCPEGRQTWGEQAASGLRKLIAGRLVLLEQHGQDQYGRTLATIYAVHLTNHEYINVNEHMFMLGHAWVNRLHYEHLPRDRQDKLNELQRLAKSKRLGLWSELNPTPPWTWRKSNGC